MSIRVTLLCLIALALGVIFVPDAQMAVVAQQVATTGEAPPYEALPRPNETVEAATVYPPIGRQLDVPALVSLPAKAPGADADVRENADPRFPVLGRARASNPRPTIEGSSADAIGPAPRAVSGGVLSRMTTGQVVWSGRIDTPADAVRVRLTEASFPAGTRLHAYGTGPNGMVLEPKAEDGDVVWTPTIAGGTIWMDVILPDAPRGSEPQSFRFVIDAIVESVNGLPAAASVHDPAFIDANCAGLAQGQWGDTVRQLQTAVGIMVAYSVQSREIYSRCTGTLITNTQQDRTPYFLTADHCLTSGAPVDIASIEVYWDYKTSSCGGSNAALSLASLASSYPRSVGAKLLDSARAHSHADFALLQLNNLPNTAAFADVQPSGFGRAFMGYATRPGVSEFLRVSHPQGRPQSYSVHQWQVEKWESWCFWWGSIFCGSRPCEGLPYDWYYYEHIKQGATVGGSSGSAAVTPDGKIVGQLYGSCSTEDLDGSMKRVYPRIAPWIAPPSDCRPVTVQPNPAEPGRGTTAILTPPNCGTLYRTGTHVRVQAAPTPGYAFQLWSAGTVDAFARDTEIVVPNNASPNVIAYFNVPPPPANDTCLAPAQITASPFVDERNTSGATTAGNDPVPPCNDSRARNVWYRYNAPATNAVRISTAGSNYNTVLSVYAGATCPVGPQAVACRQDAVGSQQELSFQAIGGTTYYIQVSSTNSDGGQLHFYFEGLVANIPPAVTDGTLTGIGGPVTTTLDGRDRDNDPLLFSIVTQPTKGIVSLVQPAAGHFTYVPQPGAVGIDTFTFKVTDGRADSNIGRMTIGLAPETAGAGATFTVNRTEDEMDVAIGNGVCLTASGGCSLRAAVLESNYAAGPVTIVLPASAQPYRLTLHGDPDINEYEHGDLDFEKQVSIVGAGAGVSVIEQDDVDRVIEVHTTARVTISGVTIRGGNTIWKGAGITNQGTLTLVRSLVTGNSTVDEGGGISATGATLIVESTITDNVGNGGEGSGVGGGGIRNDGAMAIVNSTVSGNRSDGPGGGIRNYGRLSIANSTIANNITYAGARGIDTWSEQAPALLLRNTVNIDGCSYTQGDVLSQGFNIDTRGTCALGATGDGSADPALGPLITLTSGLKLHELQAGSAAIDRGDPAGCAREGGELLTKDQGGRSRHTDGDGDGVSRCDVGAAEASGVAGVPAPADTDSDGLPDEWETRFQLSPSSALDGAADPDGDGRTNLQEFQANTHPRGIVTRYLAEGATGPFFDTRLALLNTASTPASVLLRFLKEDATVVTVQRTIPPRTRDTFDPKSVPSLAQVSFATTMEADAMVVLDRTMSWDAVGYGSHVETAAASPSRIWYLAEGSTTGGFELFYLLQNPSAVAVQVAVRYLRPSGQAPIERTYQLPPASRTTIRVNGEAEELRSTDVSAVITSNEPIIVERAMYLNRPGQVFAAGHESTGVTEPALDWFLAEGATGPFFDLFMLIANPNPTPAEVTAEYLLLGGGTLTKTYRVPAESRYTVYVDGEEIPAGSGQHPLTNVAVSTTIRSTNGVPVIVERAMWWPGPEITSDFWYEAHNSPGATGTGTRWALADGEVGGASGHDTYVLIANTSAQAGSARVTLYFEDGTQAERVYDLPASSRTNVQVGADFPSAVGRRFGTIVESLGSPAAPIVVERAMYNNHLGVAWAAGTNALATKLQ